MRILIRCVMLGVGVFLLVAPSAGQVVTGGLDTTGTVTGLQQKSWIVGGTVKTLRGDPVQGARVVIEPSVAGQFRTLKTDFQGQFITEYLLDIDLVKEFSFTLEATKKGLRKAHALVDFGSSDKPVAISVTLPDEEEDPELLSQAELLSALTPRLKALGAGDGLSASGEKDYTRGVGEFLAGNRPERALPFFNKVIRRDASCLQCRTMLALAQLASGDWGGAEGNLREATNAILRDRSVGRPEPLLAYGVMQSWRHEPENAAGFLKEALEFAPQDPLVLQELGRAQSLLQNWRPAVSYLQRALEVGAGPEARLLLAGALLGGDDSEAANQEMTRYLDGRDIKSMPLHVRELWAQIKNRKKVEVAYAKVHAESAEDIDYLRHPPADLQGLEPAQDQAPLPDILGAVGKNVAEFFKNFPNTSSLEQVRQEKLRHGKAGESRDQKFRYLCFTPDQAGAPGFTEYRLNEAEEKGGLGGLSDGFMLTSGFAASSLLFHPAYQPEATFRYLGRQKVDDRDTLVVAFAQKPTKARSFGQFKSGDTVMVVFSQGLAWVDAQTYQILRLRTDLLAPLPEVRLKKQTTEIDFAEVHFNRIAQGFWLPRDVTVTVDWNGKLLQNTHQYSDFKVFNVDATQKIGKPKEALAAPQTPGPGGLQ